MGPSDGPPGFPPGGFGSFPAGDQQSQNDEWKDGPPHNILICRDCNEYPPNLIEEFSSGDMVCGSCGLVLGDRIIDTRSEWRTFANDDQNHDDPNRVGDSINPLLNGSQLETSIAQGEGGRVVRDLFRTQNKSTENKSTKTLLQAYKDISTHCDAIGVGKTVADAAKHIFKMVDDNRVLKGKPQEAIIAGCIFISCRQCGVPRTFRDIFNLTHVSKKEIGRVFKQLEKFLSKQKTDNPSSNFLSSATGYQNTASTSAEDLCARYCSQLGFRNAPKVERVAKELATKAAKVKDLAGRSPLSVAAACIYMASHLLKEAKVSKDIAAVAGVSDGTIKTSYKFLYQARDQLVDEHLAAIGAGQIDLLPPT